MYIVLKNHNNKRIPLECLSTLEMPYFLLPLFPLFIVFIPFVFGFDVCCSMVYDRINSETLIKALGYLKIETNLNDSISFFLNEMAHSLSYNGRNMEDIIFKLI
ncbi:hypothetical protein BLOT_000187 [Blomia tropicalis]|nr:hypothetical protein BLOT_000187 [Blomia tropicalis]